MQKVCIKWTKDVQIGIGTKWHFRLQISKQGSFFSNRIFVNKVSKTLMNLCSIQSFRFIKNASKIIRSETKGKDKRKPAF